MMIVVAVALLNDRGEVLVAQRRADQSFPGDTLPFQKSTHAVHAARTAALFQICPALSIFQK